MVNALFPPQVCNLRDRLRSDSEIFSLGRLKDEDVMIVLSTAQPPYYVHSYWEARPVATLFPIGASLVFRWRRSSPQSPQSLVDLQSCRFRFTIRELR